MADDDSVATEPEPVLEPWVKIQQNTFKNWVHDKLKPLDLDVEDLKNDFKDGIKLCHLVEVLQGRSVGRIIQKPMNQYQYQGNITLALKAIVDDGVRLVNIGADDIANGNLKLILGMIWLLIRRYQIGSQTKVPPKKLMLSWIRAVLHPHLNVSNFSTDWNDGVALHGLIEYCKPGTCPQWYNMNKHDRVHNCETAMNLAKDQLDIPMVLSPEHFASPDLDELSCMTYLSYFMSVGAPGYRATMNWVREEISPEEVQNFDTDWNDGYLASALVYARGGNVEDWPNIDRSRALRNAGAAIAASQNLGVYEIPITPEDMVDPEIDHIAIMAYCAWHSTVGAKRVSFVEEPPVVIPEPEPVPTRTPTPPPPTPPPPPPPPSPPIQASFPTSLPSAWLVDQSQKITVDTEGAGGSITMTTVSPLGAEYPLAVTPQQDGSKGAIFTPNEPGRWTLNIFYDNEPIEDSPFYFDVESDPKVQVTAYGGGLYRGIAGKECTFEVDARAKPGKNLIVEIIASGTRPLSSIVTEPNGTGVYSVTYTPDHSGVHNVRVTYGGMEVEGSPFHVNIREPEVRVTATGQYYALEDAGIEVDASELGKCTLEVLIEDDQQNDVRSQIVEQLGYHIYRLHFFPQKPGLHKISIKNNSRSVQGSPWRVIVEDPKRRSQAVVH